MLTKADDYPIHQTPEPIAYSGTEVQVAEPRRLQAICGAEFESADGTIHQGKGILEQLVIGPYRPYGFADLMDLAP